MPGRVGRQRAVEHHLRAAVQPGHVRGAARRALRRPARGRAGGPASTWVARRCGVRHTSVIPARAISRSTPDRLLHRPRAVVHAGQQMRMEVDHAPRPAGEQERSGKLAELARAPRCAWARSASVIRASAASRSSATDRSPGWARTRSSACRPASARVAGSAGPTRRPRAHVARTRARSAGGA